MSYTLSNEPQYWSLSCQYNYQYLLTTYEPITNYLKCAKMEVRCTLQMSLWRKEKANAADILQRSKCYSLGFKLALQGISHHKQAYGIEAGASSLGAPCSTADDCPQPTHTQTWDSPTSYARVLMWRSRSLSLWPILAAQTSQREKHQIWKF